MVLASNSFDEFHSLSSGKKIIAFGASSFLEFIDINYRDLLLGDRISYIVDNNSGKQGTYFTIGEKRIEICSVERLLNENTERICILITSSAYAYEIYRELEANESLSKVPCLFLLYLIASRRDDIDFSLSSIDLHTGSEIPKIIHCFWFSGDKKDPKSEECLKSWKKACPDYEIREWNASNYDVNINTYTEEAFKLKKWAFVSDYARLDVIYRFGGFYFDMEVELYRSLDPLRKQDFIIGFGPYRDIEAAAFGAKKGHPFVKRIMDYYGDLSFSWENVLRGEIQPVYLNRIFSEEGFIINGRFQENKGITLIPKDVFSDRNPHTEEIHRGPNSIGVHHCTGGWWSGKSRDDHRKCKTALEQIESIYRDKGYLKE